jgi:hypothetical protein
MTSMRRTNLPLKGTKVLRVTGRPALSSAGVTTSRWRTRLRGDPPANGSPLTYAELPQNGVHV